MEDSFLTVAEVAELPKLNQQTVRNWIDRGELPAVRVGQRRVRAKRSDLDRLIENGYTRRESGTSSAPATSHLGFGTQAIWARFGDASLALSEAIGRANREEVVQALGAVAAAAKGLADAAVERDN